MLKGNQSELRMFERRILRAPAYLIHNDQQHFKVRTLDISIAGLSVISENNLAIETALLIHLTIPARQGVGEPFTVDVVVRNSTFSNNDNGFRIGLKFSKPPLKLTAAILQLMDSEHTHSIFTR